MQELDHYEPTEEELGEIEQQAELMFTVPQVALLFGLPERVFHDENSFCKVAYDRGLLRGEAEVRLYIFEMARQGSGHAQKQMVEFARVAVAANRESAIGAGREVK